MALKAHIGGAFLNMANGATFNWSDIDVPDTLNTLRELASNNTLSEENRQAIREICWVTETDADSDTGATGVAQAQ
jgi:hypothetical protein